MAIGMLALLGATMGSIVAAGEAPAAATPPLIVSLEDGLRQHVERFNSLEKEDKDLANCDRLKRLAAPMNLQ